MTRADPERDRLIGRLREERARVATFLARPPELEDREFESWRDSVVHLFDELFKNGSYSKSFLKIPIHTVRRSYTDATHSGGVIGGTWNVGLRQAERLLDNAIEEAEINLPTGKNPAPRITPKHQPPV